MGFGIFDVDPCLICVHWHLIVDCHPSRVQSVKDRSEFIGNLIVFSTVQTSLSRTARAKMWTYFYTGFMDRQARLCLANHNSRRESVWKRDEKVLALTKTINQRCPQTTLKTIKGMNSFRGFVMGDRRPWTTVPMTKNISKIYNRNWCKSCDE